MSRWAAEQMEQQNGGVIINVSSLASERADGLSPAYIACKGALNSLTYELASLYGSKGIRVVSIRPGAIATEMAGDYQDAQGSNLTQELRKNWEESIPLKRMGSPEEIAKTIVWLSDDQASYITGTSLLVDGGWEHNLSPYRLKHLQYPKEFL
jgi:NAD(P)-dependent dehydrogenase (short-subunit alcohol dehydrogenase family)